MADNPRRYTFSPLEKRGVLLGLEAGQLLTIVGGVLVSLLLVGAAPRPIRVPAAIVVLGASVGAALWPVGGRTLIAWLPFGAGWLARRAAGPKLDPRPSSGGPASTAARRSPLSVAGSSLTPGITVSRLAAEPGSPEVGVIRDGRSGAWTAVLPVGGRSFSLLDVAEQVQRLDSWRAVLGAVGRPATPVRRLQWVERSAPTAPAGNHRPDPRRPGRDGGAPDPVTRRATDSYQALVVRAAPATQTHDVWLALSLGFRHRPSVPVADGLRRELRLLEGQLRNADLRPGCPLAAVDISTLLGPAPMAVDEQWSYLRVDDEWHATYWVAEWPRVEVNPDFLAPLLVCDGRRTVSVVMAPVPAGRAIREARSARTADLADAELRSRAGFLSSARREREADGAIQRESELADGHSEFRFSGYVTVTAGDRKELDSACAAAEHAAQSARIELRRLYGRQAEAFSWTLPLGRGLT